MATEARQTELVAKHGIKEENILVQKDVEKGDDFMITRGRLGAVLLLFVFNDNIID